jgi:hypothetical protein
MELAGTAGTGIHQLLLTIEDVTLLFPYLFQVVQLRVEFTKDKRKRG